MSERLVGRLDAQDGLGREPKEQVAAGFVVRPSPAIPRLPGEVIAGVEHLPEGDVPELGDGEEGGGLHLDREAALGHAPADLVSGLAVDPVRRPRLAGHVRDAMRVERGHDGLERIGRRGDFARGGQVVIARALVADGRRRNDDVANHETRDQDTGAGR